MHPGVSPPLADAALADSTLPPQLMVEMADATTEEDILKTALQVLPDFFPGMQARPALRSLPPAHAHLVGARLPSDGVRTARVLPHLVFLCAPSASVAFGRGRLLLHFVSTFSFIKRRLRRSSPTRANPRRRRTRYLGGLCPEESRWRRNRKPGPPWGIAAPLSSSFVEPRFACLSHNCRAHPSNFTQSLTS